MGGLKKDLPITYWTFLIASIAIAGVPFLSGFFSKDEILFETFSNGHTILWVMGALTSLLTATYMFRLVFLTFFGTRREAPAAAAGHGAHGHAAHGEAPWTMVVALVATAAGTVALFFMPEVPLALARQMIGGG